MEGKSDICPQGSHPLAGETAPTPIHAGISGSLMAPYGTLAERHMPVTMSTGLELKHPGLVTRRT